LVNTSPATEQWLSLTDAANRLGVHMTTLRRWADNGEFPFMRTPGGHRRFALADVERFMNENRRQPASTSLELVWMEQAMTHARREIVAHRADKVWLTVQGEDRRRQHRLLGQRLMGLTLQYISDVEGNGSLLEEARVVGEQYGRLALADNLPLTAAIQAAIFFRDMLVETALQLPDGVTLRPEANLRLMQRINKLLNTVQLAIAAVYE
jgi:excisionase family DNA binding protein